MGFVSSLKRNPIKFLLCNRKSFSLTGSIFLFIFFIYGFFTFSFFCKCRLRRFIFKSRVFPTVLRCPSDRGRVDSRGVLGRDLCETTTRTGKDLVPVSESQFVKLIGTISLGEIVNRMYYIIFYQIQIEKLFTEILLTKISF